MRRAFSILGTLVITVLLLGQATLPPGGGGGQSAASASATITFVDQIAPTGTINGVNGSFTLPNTPSSGSLYLWRNGLLLKDAAGVDYTLSGNTITFESGQEPRTGDVLLASYRY